MTRRSIPVDQEVSVLTDLFCNSRGTGKMKCEAHGWSYIKTANIHDRVFYNRMIKTSDENFKTNAELKKKKKHTVEGTRNCSYGANLDEKYLNNSNNTISMVTKRSE